MTDPARPPADTRVLLLAATRKDAAAGGDLLARAGLGYVACLTPAEACREVAAGAGVLVTPEEGLLNDSSGALAEALRRQPRWSDLPLVVLTPPGRMPDGRVRAITGVGTVTLLKRPLEAAVFVNAVRAALRDRERQYQVRDHLAEQARQADALREADRRKDDFLAMLAHELRNPLAPVRNGLEILRLADEGRAVGRGAAVRTREMIERQVQHLTRLVDDLLDVSRITRGKVELRPERVDLAVIAARAAETARPLVDARGHRLAVTTPPRPVWVTGDPTRLTQVLANLLANAAKYSDDGADITLTVAAGGGAAVARVRDTGMGIPADVLPRVFDLFTQADRTLDRAQGGLGIGLTLARSLVEMHGGRIEAFSEGEGKGSEFVVHLPCESGGGGREAGVEPAREVAFADSLVTVSESRRVLVVDDNADAGETLAVFLRLFGHDVRTARDAVTAVEAARDFRPQAAVLDIGLPGESGYDLARRFRAEPFGRSALLVALTGYGQDEDRRLAREAGFDHHLTKPADPAALAHLIASVALAASPARE